MPIAHFHLVHQHHSSGQGRDLAVQASRAYAEVLDCPIDRVRVFLHWFDPDSTATAGIPVADGGAPAPYFTALVLSGRPERQRHDLLSRLTDVVVAVLGCRRELVRGRIEQVDPTDWGIGGTPAAFVRDQEIAARAHAAEPG